STHFCFFFSSRRRHTRFSRDWSSDVCSSDLKSPFTSPSASVWLNMHGDYTHLMSSQTLALGDVNGDLRINFHDLVAFRQAYEDRSEERRVGKECRYRWSACD